MSFRAVRSATVNAGNVGSLWTPPTAPARRKLVVICGQSNAVGTGAASNLTGNLAHYANRYKLPLRANTGNDNDPPTTIDHDWADLGPRLSTSGQMKFGIELSMARGLEQAQPQQWAILKCARSSTQIDNWTGSWPSLDPDGLSIRERLISQTQTALDTYPYDLAAFIWIQGEADASTEAAASAYTDKLLTFIDQLRATFSGTPFLYGRLASTANLPARDTLRASQAAALGQRPDLYMIDQDGHTLDASDNIHFNHVGLCSLGLVYSDALLAL